MTIRRATLTCAAAMTGVVVFASACTSSTSGDTSPTSGAAGSNTTQSGAGPSASGSGSAATAPKAVPGAVTGLVVDKGDSVAHARIKVVITPSTRSVGALKRGKKVTGKVAAVAVSTMPDGKFTARLDRRLVTAKFRDGATINVEIFVLSPKGNAIYAVPMTLAKGKLQGVSTVFDLGAKTINVNGTTSALLVS